MYPSPTPSRTLTSHPGDEADGEPIKLDQIGISHFSFCVRDIRALAEELTSEGVQLATRLEAVINAQGEAGSSDVYEPDGILIQSDSGGGS